MFGPEPEKENSPYHILNALDLGYDVEVDVWVNGKDIHFGHDEPQWLYIPESFLIEIGHKTWFHCKNFEAFNFFNSVFPQLNYFWHQQDDYTLTSQGFIWTYPGKEIGKNSIIVDLDGKTEYNCYGICSDYLV